MRNTMIKRIFLVFALIFASIGQPVAPVSVPVISHISSAITSRAQATPVASISLPSSITAWTRTSASGVTPMTWNLSLGSNVYAGYNLIFRVYSDSGLSTKTQEVTHRLTEADMQPGATLNLAADGLVAPGATDWVTVAVGTISPAGRVSEWLYPTALTPTDATAAMTWSASDKTAGIALSGGNLFAVQNSAPGGVRSSRGVSSGKFYVEFVTAGGQIDLYDGTASLTVDQERTADGGTPSAHAATYPSNTNVANYNTTTIVTPGYSGAIFTAGISGTTMTTATPAVGSLAIGQYVAGPGIAWGTKITAGSGTSWTVNISQTVVDSGSFIVSGALIGMAVDVTNNKLWLATNNVWANSGNPAAGTGGLSIAGIGTPVFPAIQIPNGYRVGFFPGTQGLTTGFAFTPPTGFVGP